MTTGNSELSLNANNESYSWYYHQLKKNIGPTYNLVNLMIVLLKNVLLKVYF